MVRWLEFIAFFVAAPVGIAVFLPVGLMFPALFAVTAVGLVLLAVTPGFSWGSLLSGLTRVSWALVAIVGVTSFAASYIILWNTAPGRLFQLLGEGAPTMWGGWPVMVVIAALYPWVSALPQEIVFRPLFFRRYGHLFGRVALWANAAIFSLAHLMYWSWIVAAMTFAGGLLFAWSYERRGNFPEAVLTHSVAGIALFAAGMGAYFYTGNVVRPF
ncbi:CAAX prenyl protease-like protein [Litoreibacter ponti]|uniref:CAAX prenyl protease-like protein n=1 Tax=Litoreibacter ponti TaxID=1510457 RepID=A0A2T6BLX1_9RHOB|nr:CPBP family intramembrane glutamic endopeptidase [Litoreibacter ponti]PTX57059.1 CAAX prenyl protease-like protein [Litoreibacter ponti]